MEQAIQYPQTTPSEKNWQEILAWAVKSVAALQSKLIGLEINEAVSRQSLATKLLMLIAGKQAEKSIAPYISAVVFLAFTGRSISRENVSKVLGAAGFQVSARPLNFISTLNFKNTLAYAPAIYYISVMNSVKLGPDSLMNVVNAMGVESDGKTAAKVIKIYSELASQKESSQRANSKDSLQQKLDLAIAPAANMTADTLINELNRIFEYEDTQENMRNGLVPYIAAAGVLEFIGRDPTAEGLESFLHGVKRVVNAVGIRVDNGMLDYIRKLNLGRTPLIYVPALYFLASLEKGPTVEGIVAILDSIKAPSDPATAGYFLTLYNSNKS